MTCRRPTAWLEDTTAARRLAAHWVLLLGIVIYLLLFGWNSLTRTRTFSPDSMNYVDVARNIAVGRGIVQSTLGFNQSRFLATDSIPSPLTAQPPLYPLVITLLGSLGVPDADSALLVSVICYALMLVTTYLLARQLHDGLVALVATAALTAYAPVVSVARVAWSESLGIFLSLTCFWLLVMASRRPQLRARYALLGGAAGGLAFATRYALAPVLAIAFLFILLERRRWRERAATSVAFGLGAAVPAGAVVARNLALTGSALGAQPNPSTVGPVENLREVLSTLSSQYALGVDPRIQLGGLLLVLLACTVVVLRREGALNFARRAYSQDGRFVLWLYALCYLGFLIYQRSQTHFDPIDLRLVAPAGPMLVIVAVVLVTCAAGGWGRYLPFLAVTLLCLSIYREARLAMTFAPAPQQAALASERLSWIAQHTTDRDLIIGDDTVDVPFYLGRTRAVSFSPYPYTDFVGYQQLADLVSVNRGIVRTAYLIVRDRHESDAGWRRQLGPFIADIVSGRLDAYPGLVPRERLRDAFVFEISVAQSGSPEAGAQREP